VGAKCASFLEVRPRVLVPKLVCLQLIRLRLIAERRLRPNSGSGKQPAKHHHYRSTYASPTGHSLAPKIAPARCKSTERASRVEPTLLSNRRLLEPNLCPLKSRCVHRGNGLVFYFRSQYPAAAGKTVWQRVACGAPSSVSAAARQTA